MNKGFTFLPSKKAKPMLKFYNTGFTLIELLLVVAVMLTLSVVAGAFYSRFLLQNSVANTVDQLVGSLRKAQIYSMTGRRGSSWGVDYSNNKITLYKGIALGQDPGFNEEFSINSNVTISGLSNVYFYKMSGTPSGVLTITISGNNSSKNVTLNSQGMAEKQ